MLKDERVIKALRKDLDFESTSEIIVGTGSNGKPIYEKKLIGTVAKNTTTNFPISDNVINAVIKEGFINTSGGNYVPLNFYATDSARIRSSVISNNLRIIVSDSSAMSGNFQATIRYQKSTDKA